MEKWNIRKNKMLPVIFALAWPTMLEQFLQTAVQYIDTAMVGSLGTQATAAVGSTSTVNWLIGSTISAIGVGLLAFIKTFCMKNNMTPNAFRHQILTPSDIAMDDK